MSNNELTRMEAAALQEGIMKSIQDTKSAQDKIRIMRSFIRGVETHDKMLKTERANLDHAVAFYRRYADFASGRLGVPKERVYFMLLRNINACFGCAGNEYPAGVDVEIVNLMLLHKDVLGIPKNVEDMDDETAERVFEKAEVLVRVNLVVDDPKGEIGALGSMRPEIGEDVFFERIGGMSVVDLADHEERLTNESLRPVLTTLKMKANCELPVMTSG